MDKYRIMAMVYAKHTNSAYIMSTAMSASLLHRPDMLDSSGRNLFYEIKYTISKHISSIELIKYIFINMVSQYDNHFILSLAIGFLWKNYRNSYWNLFNMEYWNTLPYARKILLKNLRSTLVEVRHQMRFWVSHRINWNLFLSYTWVVMEQR